MRSDDWTRIGIARVEEGRAYVEARGRWARAERGMILVLMAFLAGTVVVAFCAGALWAHYAWPR